MQAGQVSVWVPIVVGIIGLVGVVAGQLVNAWREDRRWTREQEREREKDQAREVYEYEKHWLDRKIDAYAQLLEATRRWAKQVELISSPINIVDPNVLYEVTQVFETARGLVEVVGSEAVVSLADAQHSIFMKFSVHFVTQKEMSELYGDSMESLRQKLDESYREMRQIIRQELHIEPSASFVQNHRRH